MLGSLDCLHWELGNCMNAYQGQYIQGDHGYPTIILKVLTVQDLWIWHTFYGSTGSMNDINVLNMSCLNDKKKLEFKKDQEKGDDRF